MRNAFDDTSLVTAVGKGHFHRVRGLIDDGCDVNERGDKRMTSLMLCCYVREDRWAVSMARMLLEKEANLGLCDVRGRNALIHACLTGRTCLVNVYISSVDFQLNHTDCEHMTALGYAVLGGNIDIVSMLVEALTRYGQAVDKPCKNSITPFTLALILGYVECAEVIAENSTDGAERGGKIDALCRVRRAGLPSRASTPGRPVTATRMKLRRDAPRDSTVPRYMQGMRRSQPEAAGLNSILPDFLGPQDSTDSNTKMVDGLLRASSPCRRQIHESSFSANKRRDQALYTPPKNPDTILQDFTHLILPIYKLYEQQITHSFRRSTTSLLLTVTPADARGTNTSAVLAPSATQYGSQTDTDAFEFKSRPASPILKSRNSITSSMLEQVSDSRPSSGTSVVKKTPASRKPRSDRHKKHSKIV